MSPRATGLRWGSPQRCPLNRSRPRQLRQRLQRAPLSPGRRWEVVRVLLAEYGEDHWIDHEGSFWRAISFIDGSQSFDTIEEMRSEAQAWRDHRNNAHARIDWQFTTADARTKLKRLYPTLDA